MASGVAAAGLARQIYLSYTGAMTLWSSGRLDDQGFSTAARHGLFTALAAAAVDGERERFLEQLRVLGSTLETESWNPATGTSTAPTAPNQTPPDRVG